MSERKVGKLGRIPTPMRLQARMPKLRNYAKLPAVPEHWDLSDRINPWPMFLNDQLGDCTCAAIGHLVQLWSQGVGQQRDVTDDDVLGLYEELGYNPDDPASDQGASMLDALQVWQAFGCVGDTATAWAAVNVHDQDEVARATYAFSGLYAALAIPSIAMEQFRMGHPWDVSQNDGGIAGGHCVPIVGYDAYGVTCITWGQAQRVTWQFWASYFNESYAVIPSDDLQLGTNRLPNGLDLAQLQQDLAALTNR